jgi:hypothetical protein
MPLKPSFGGGPGVTAEAAKVMVVVEANTGKTGGDPFEVMLLVRGRLPSSSLN